MPEWPAWLVASFELEQRETKQGDGWVRDVVVRCKQCPRAWSMAPNGLENPNTCSRLIEHAKTHRTCGSAPAKGTK
jgi:hypothetical protein